MDMEAVSFDTLKLAKRLEASGLTASVSAGVSEALADVLSTTALATKADVVASETAVRAGMKEMETSIRADMKTSEIGTDRGFRTLEATMRTGFELLHRDMEILRHDIITRGGAMLTIAVSIILAAMRYMPPRL
jgi:hypothetical protein